MFQKILVSDDLGSINKGVISVLEQLSIKDFEEVQYCDDAYLRIKAAYKTDKPFDLLITDLSFIPDHRDQRLTSGEALIEVLKKEHPQLKIIVFTVEEKLQKVRYLMMQQDLDAYVCKGRPGLKDLRQAITDVFEGKTFVSTQVSQALTEKTDLEISDYDIELIQQLSNGLSQEQISELFKKQQTTPNSLSSIEKHLNKLRIQFKANNAIHLVAIVKDLGLI